MAEIEFITGKTGVLTTTISDIESKIQNVTNETDEKFEKLTDKIDDDFKVFDHMVDKGLIYKKFDKYYLAELDGRR